uniref:Uroporphyrinogen decarboxylase 1ic isoform X2 n=1 Tax=Rhizophora mucronata TaxID=61149 RepID=A0A2P2L514_RHIMU
MYLFLIICNCNEIVLYQICFRVIRALKEISEQIDFY